MGSVVGNDYVYLVKFGEAGSVVIPSQVLTRQERCRD